MHMLFGIGDTINLQQNFHFQKAERGEYLQK